MNRLPAWIAKIPYCLGPLFLRDLLAVTQFGGTNHSPAGQLIPLDTDDHTFSIDHIGTGP